MKGVWIDKSGEFDNGEMYVCGGSPLGAVDYNVFAKLGEKDIKENWLASCWLPSGTVFCAYPTIEEAKAAIEREVWHWFNNLEHTK